MCSLARNWAQQIMNPFCFFLKRELCVVVLSSVCVSDIDRSGRLMLPNEVIYVQSFSLRE